VNIPRIGAAILAVYGAIAVFAPILAPFDPSDYKTQPFLPPDSIHLLGANDIGQDIFSELIAGTRLSLLVGFVAGAVSITIGILFGVTAGWFGGLLDQVLSAVCAFFITLPFFPLVIVISALIKGGTLTSAIILGLLGWTETARVLRAQTVLLRSQQYIQDIRAMGAGNGYILLKHILRALFPMVAYRFILRFRSGILAESALSFLGLGSPIAKSWGTMLYYAQARNAFIIGAWKWWILPPGLALTGLVCALVMIGYYFEEKSDPRIAKDGYV
jgi:ABC-type dipeptide/oligopeptide/nickel transport system permease subunit